jgi:hypothetical protein
LPKWLERCQAKKMKENEKLTKEIIKTQTEDAVVLAKEIPAEDDAEDVEEAVGGAVEEETIVTILKMWNVSIVTKRATILLNDHSQEKMTMNSQTWFTSRISKTYSNTH